MGLTTLSRDLSISNNDALTSLSGLDNFSPASIDDINITGNDNLSYCEIESICYALFFTTGEVIIEDNATGCNSREEVEEECGLNDACLPEGITFNSQAEIDSFQVNYPGCAQIAGYVSISGDDISNLNGLNGLNSIWGSLYISNNDSLDNLSGLENLASIGGSLDISQNQALTDLSGLEGLTSLTGSLLILGNDSLVSLEGLEGLTTVNGNLQIGGDYYYLGSNGKPFPD